ncbi:hypothetical protein B0H10DRAFT_1962932 [Mycena sp. CBHHK59/15]|nr:hypothetical protein B0H10DRAFT_1962932 [Mycena sp. CBHHK59/15]
MLVVNVSPVTSEKVDGEEIGTNGKGMGGSRWWYSAREEAWCQSRRTPADRAAACIRARVGGGVWAQQTDARADECRCHSVCSSCGLHRREGYGSGVWQQKGIPRKGGTASTLSPSHLVLQSAAAEFRISHQSAAAVVWTVREARAHSAAQFGGAGAFGVPFPRTHHAQALNVWPPPSKLAAAPRTRSVWRARNDSAVVSGRSWTTGAYLANPSKLAAAARARSKSGAQKDAAEVEGGS